MGTLLPTSPVLPEPFTSSGSGFGGPPWPRTQGHSSPPVKCVPRENPLIAPPSSLLNSLPIPRRPWSHIALDFVTGLPPSSGHIVVLTIVDCFSKSVHLVALPKLPSAAETGALLVLHVFKLHRIPYDIVSDRGPSALHLELR